MDELLTVVPIILVIYAVGVTVFLAFSEMFRAPRFVRKTRNRRASKRLDAELNRVSAAQTDLVVYWDQYRDLTKFEVFAAAERAGFLFVDQELNENGWALNFTRA